MILGDPTSTEAGSSKETNFCVSAPKHPRQTFTLMHLNFCNSFLDAKRKTMG